MSVEDLGYACVAGEGCDLVGGDETVVSRVFWDVYKIGGALAFPVGFAHGWIKSEGEGGFSRAWTGLGWGLLSGITFPVSAVVLAVKHDQFGKP